MASWIKGHWYCNYGVALFATKGSFIILLQNTLSLFRQWEMFWICEKKLPFNFWIFKHYRLVLINFVKISEYLEKSVNIEILSRILHLDHFLLKCIGICQEAEEAAYRILIVRTAVDWVATDQQIQQNSHWWLRIQKVGPKLHSWCICAPVPPKPSIQIRLSKESAQWWIICTQSFSNNVVDIIRFCCSLVRH